MTNNSKTMKSPKTTHTASPNGAIDAVGARRAAIRKTGAAPRPNATADPVTVPPPRAKPRKATTKAAKVELPKPHGRDEIVDSIIDATISLWTAQGTEGLSLRSIAARAGVNYGLVHRHFGTKDAVIRAAMDRVVKKSLEFIDGSENLTDAIDRVLPYSTGSHARLLAWTILQYVVEDILPERDMFLERLRELALVDKQRVTAEDKLEAAVTVGSVMAMLWGWRLFEPYLLRELGLQSTSRAKVDSLVRTNLVKILSA